MSKFAEILKDKRAKKMLKLKEVSDALNIDVALVSKIERGDRRATKKQALAFIKFYDLQEKEMLILWLSEKIVSELKDEKYALDSLYVAEESLKNIIQKKDKPIQNAQINALIKEIEKQKLIWEKVKKEHAPRLKEIQMYFILLNVYESNKFAGNSLTYHETNSVINEGNTIEGKSMQEHLEAINLFEAIEFMNELDNDTGVSNKNLLALHHLLLKGIDRKNAGKYRTIPITDNASKHIPPQADLIEKKLEEIFTFYQEYKHKTHSIILATEIYEKIVYLKPFLKENDKLALLFLNFILKINGHPLVHIKGNYKTKLVYFKALEKAHIKKDNKDFKIFICKQILVSIQKHIETIEIIHL